MSGVVILLSIFYILNSKFYVFAFTGPSASPPSGSGAIGTDSAKNVSFGTSTTSASTKVYIVASSTSNADYSIRVVQPAGAPLFNVRNDGIIGIATTTTAGATTALIVQGDAFFSGTVTAATFSGPISGTVNAINVSAGTFGAATGFGNYTFGTSTNPILHIDNTNARVGIGTTGPTFSIGRGLHIAGVSGTPDTVIRLSEWTSGLGNFELRSTARGTSGNRLEIGEGSDTFLTIRSDDDGGGTTLRGNVGIGTTGPNAKLEVAGNVRVTGGSELELLTSVGNERGTFLAQEASPHLLIRTSGGEDIGFQDGAETNLFIEGSNGNVGIGAAPGSYKLDVSGTGHFTGQVNFDSHIQMAASTNLYLNGGTTYGLTSQDLRIDTLNTGSTNDPLEINYRVAGPTKVCASVNCATYSGYFDTSGSVGIGVIPGYKLDVVSGGATTARFGTGSSDTVIVGGGAGKIDVGTVDPIYTIGGVRYATYLPAMTGVKEETTGVINVKCQMSDVRCEHVIDFNKVEVGSDLWLFSKTTDLKRNFANMAVLLSPAFPGRAWYTKDSARQILTIYAESPDSRFQIPDSHLEISYRLTAPRFDATEWSNYASDSDVSGFVIHE